MPKKLHIDCNNCEHMFPNEEQQEKLTHYDQHLCTLEKRKVLHAGEHPRLPTPEWCPLDADENGELLQKDWDVEVCYTAHRYHTFRVSAAHAKAAKAQALADAMDHDFLNSPIRTSESQATYCNKVLGKEDA